MISVTLQMKYDEKICNGDIVDFGGGNMCRCPD